MGPEAIILTVLGIPVSWLTSLTFEKIKAFSGKIETIPLQGLFINSFLKSLDRHKKGYAQGVKKLKKSIKQEGKQAEFLKIFSANVENYSSFISALQNETFQKTAAQEIVDHFHVEDNFKEVMVLIVRDCLIDYRAMFLKTMTEKQGIQLLILLQGQSTDVILSAIETLEEKLFSRFKKLVDRETEKNKPTIELKIKAKQIKILSITASPEGENYILYEQEQDTLLEVFKDFDRELVFLDMPDPVKSTLTEIREHLEDGHHDILYLTAHGVINEKGTGVLSFEDHQGNLEQVAGEELIKVLNPTPKIVILSACHSARQEPDLMPAARALFEAGIETVIGMKKAVSHAAAIEFNAAFFNALCQNKTVKQAFASGKQAILTGEQRRIKEIPGWDAVNEYEIPQLLARDENLTVDNFSDHRIEAPGRPESHHFLGAKYLERGFIGRRRVLRDIFRSIENKPGAVVLKGPGGIGKSTLTTRTAANLRRKGYDFIVARGETTIEQILEIISRKAAASGVKDAEKVYAANADPNEKLNWYLDRFLLKQKLVIIFDNFEENQDEAKAGEFKGERLKKFLWFFRDSLKHHETFLFFSTRYTLPGFDSPDMTKNIPEFTTVEFRKMLLNSQSLKHLGSKSVKNLIEDIGGNPRALELLDKIAYKKYREQEFTWEQLKDLIPELRQRIIKKRGKGDDFTPLFLNTLLGYLCETQRRLLDILSIYRHPVPGEAAAVQNVGIEDDDCTKLEDLSLLEGIALEDKNLYYVHRLTAQYLLQQMKASERKKYHKEAAGYFAALHDEEGKVYLKDLIEARWHYLQAGEWDKAAEITFELEDYLSLRGYPQWAMELLQELELDLLNETNKIVTYGQIGSLYQDFGEYDKALDFHNRAYEISQKYNDQKNSATALHQFGNIYYLKGDYDEALKQYQKSMEIKEKIGDIKGVSYSLHQIGMIYQDKGDYDAALKQYHKSLEMKEKIGDIKGVSSSLHQIGMIYQDKGDYDAALKQYHKSLEILEKIGDIKGLSDSLHQIGMIYQYKGDYDAALNEYQKSLEIREKIGDIKGVSSSLHQIGMIYQYKGDYDAALKQYEKAKEISEKIGDIAGTALSMAQIGTLYFKQNNFETALAYFIQAFLVFAKIGSPYANQARKDIARVREKLPEDQFNAILKKFNLTPEDLP
jgi:tetratricopeptide (TPR) repeat protein